jgi:hypothetical protein
MVGAGKQNTSTSSTQMINGWVRGPTGRGTWDIIETCVVTVLLCSWSSLVLHLHSRTSRWAFLHNKLRWMFFTIFWPEVTLGTAVEQWESASQSVEDFAKSGYPQWTMRHAFLADMGGLVLQSPDFSPFPVDSKQLLYLIQKKYVSYPYHVDVGTIWDKNKADGFARSITLVQITWFILQSIGRAIQQLPITTLELLTITFIFCTLPTFFLWYHKPLDIQTPIFLQTDTRIGDILIDAGDDARNPYKLTPLDFLDVPPAKENFVAAWWWGVMLCFDGVLFRVNEKERPLMTFANSKTHPQRGYTVYSFCARVIWVLGYFAIHFAGWNLVLPTNIEKQFWHAAILYFISICTLYLIVFGVVSSASHWMAKRWFDKDASSFIEVLSLFPRWLQLLGLLPIYGTYGIARIYMLVECFISLRSLPREVFTTVDWSSIIPHV